MIEIVHRILSKAYTPEAALAAKEMNALYMQPENAGLLSFLEVSLHFLFVTLHGKGFYFAWTPPILQL